MKRIAHGDDGSTANKISRPVRIGESDSEDHRADFHEQVIRGSGEFAPSQ